LLIITYINQQLTINAGELRKNKMTNSTIYKKMTKQHIEELGLDYQTVLDHNIAHLEYMDSDEFYELEPHEQLKHVKNYLNCVCPWNVTDVWFSYVTPLEKFRVTIELRSGDGKTGSSCYFFTSPHRLASTFKNMQNYIDVK
jgi:hypothetical protein